MSPFASRLGLLLLPLLACAGLTPASAQPSSQWSRCASENEPCYLPYPAVVAYGARGVWSKRVFNRPGNIDCSNFTFGDPLPGVRKSCHFQVARGDAPPPPGFMPPGFMPPGPMPPPGRQQWSTCAMEREPCYVPYPTTVAYGANGMWTQIRVDEGSIDCSNRTFGDPIPGVRKSCRFRVRF